ncbi:MAG: hypothetical protein IJG87_00950 [Ruminococcus sp.]|nr:hypothetical protein [Ruminococcus sp.]
MITIQNGKLIIPDDDRFVGFAGDNAITSKRLVLMNEVDTSSSYTLCLRFDDDTVRSVPLSAAADGGNTVLTWDIAQEHLYAPGIVQAQVKIVGSDDVTRHTAKDFFLIGSAVELDDDGGEAEYVTPSQLENSIQQALQTVTATSPYVDSDGYWCIYDTQRGEYVRTAYHVSGVAPDSAMSDSSDNSVSNRVIKQYADAKAADCNTYSTAYTDLKTSDKVPNTRKIAQLPLTSDIDASDLMDVLRPYSYRVNINPNNSGVKGQMGIGVSGEVFYCTATDRWVHLASYTDLYDKMDLVTEVSAAEMDDVDDGNMFFSGGTLYVKYDGDSIAVAQANDVYSKAEIDTMIGNLESLLAAI